MNYLLGSVLDAFFPRLCPVCGCSLVRGETLMCLSCLAALPRTRMHLRPDNSITARLTRPGLRLELAAAWMDYSRHSPYAAVIRDAKYAGMPRIAREAGRLFAREMLADAVPALADIDVLLPVPMHWTRLLRRGYNQSREIALGISAATGIPVGDNLHALRGHATQTRRSVEERMRNVGGIIAVRRPAELLGLHVAVVDDVITSGATLADALHALRAQAQPRAMSVLTIGAVRSDEWMFKPSNA